MTKTLIFQVIFAASTISSYQITDKVDINSEEAHNFLKPFRKPRSVTKKSESINEELKETCIDQICSKDEHDSLELWEEKFEPARVHAEEKTEEKSELMESQAEFSEIKAVWDEEIREKFYLSILDEVILQRNQSWTKLRNNCDFEPCNENGTENCVQTWNARTCFCKEGYYGENCEKGGPCDCEKKQKEPVQVSDDIDLIENEEGSSTSENFMSIVKNSTNTQ